MADLVTDEEVEAVILATADLPQRGIIRAALEAFAPLLIERLAKEVEDHANGFARQLQDRLDATGSFSRKDSWGASVLREQARIIRSKKDTPHED